MNHLDLTLPSPAENLAAEEVLLEGCENGQGSEVLRFWESPHYFVVVGYANKIATEVNAAACAEQQIPILRRSSGGGTVIQGPGCLNYALVLQITETGPLRNITTANQFIMERNRQAMETLLHRPVQIRGHTDLAIDDLKFSGNSQRRRKHYLLFHGSLLLDFDLSLISKLLPMPSMQPDYRDGRPHQSFLTNIHVSTDAAKAALAQAWNATDPLPNIPTESIKTLARDKYFTDDWNFRF